MNTFISLFVIRQHECSQNKFVPVCTSLFGFLLTLIKPKTSLSCYQVLKTFPCRKTNRPRKSADTENINDFSLSNKHVIVDMWGDFYLIFMEGIFSVRTLSGRKSSGKRLWCKRNKTLLNNACCSWKLPLSRWLFSYNHCCNALLSEINANASVLDYSNHFSMTRIISDIMGNWPLRSFCPFSWLEDAERGGDRRAGRGQNQASKLDMHKYSKLKEERGSREGQSSARQMQRLQQLKELWRSLLFQCGLHKQSSYINRCCRT